MIFDFESHYDQCVLIPSPVISIDQCENHLCNHLHVRFSLSLLFWTIGLNV